MSRQVMHLGVPPVGLSINDTGDGALKVELDVPSPGHTLEHIPFLEITRNAQAVLLNGARQDVLAKLNESGFAIGGVMYEDSSFTGALGDGAVDKHAPKLGKVSFEISSDAKVEGGLNATPTNHPDFAHAIGEAERNFDLRRHDMYETCARQWHRQGGATLEAVNGETYQVTAEAAKHYINERYPLSQWERVGIDDGSAPFVEATPTLVAGNDALNRQFAQALNGAGGDRDTAAVAIDTIRHAPGYKPDQEIRLLQGKQGLVVSQGDGPAALNLPVPQAQPGDFEKVAAQMMQQQQQTTMRSEPQGRNAPTV